MPSYPVGGVHRRIEGHGQRSEQCRKREHRLNEALYGLAQYKTTMWQAGGGRMMALKAHRT